MKLPLKTGEGKVLPEEERSPGRLLLENQKIVVAGINLSASTSDKKIQAAEAPARATIGALTGGVILASPGAGLGMLKILQYYEYLQYINVQDIPENFLAFLDIFKQNLFDFAPNPFEMDETDPEKVAEAKRLEEERAAKEALDNGETARRNLIEDENSEEMLPNFSYCRMNQHLVAIEQNCFFLNNSGNHVL